jgi:hypothetical protein
MVIATHTDNKMSPELKDWLECKAFILAMKANHVTTFDFPDTSSLRMYDSSIDKIFEPQFSSNQLIDKQLRKVSPDNLAMEMALNMAEEVAGAIKADLEQLKNTPLPHKREVLNHLQVVSSAIAAAYLGISENILNEMKNATGQLFGAQYHGGHCYSMEELNLIASNMRWMPSCYVQDRAIEHVASYALDEIIMVDPIIAFYYTDETVLSNGVPITSMLHRCYRLADLEKIRIAKLNAV